jgi:cytochrome c oxidase assembly factor CtaG
MAEVSRSGFFRGLIVFICAGAAFIVGYYGVSLLVEAFNRHGSPGGDALLFTLGVILLVLSPVAFIAGIVYWTSARSSPGEKDS